MSLRELWTVKAAILERHQEQLRRDLTLAWHVAVLQRQKRVPDLKKLLGKLSPDQGPQTVEHQRAMLSMLSAMHGGQLQATKTRTPK